MAELMMGVRLQLVLPKLQLAKRACLVSRKTGGDTTRSSTGAPRPQNLLLKSVMVTGCDGGSPNSGWQIVVDSSVIATAAGDAANWEPTSADFVATGPTTSVCFRIPDGAGGIDALSVVEQ